MADEHSGSPRAPRAGWRIKLGFTIFAASIAWPLLMPVLPVLGLSTAATATFGGSMLVAAEILLLVAAAIAGKDGFAYIKARVFGLLRSFGPPQRVGAMRYRIGLVMFSVPLLVGWLAPYVGSHIPGFEEHAIAASVALDALLLASLFVLGGEFWDKLRALYVHGGAAGGPAKPAPDGPAS
jgi:hypothetical protein